MSTCAKSHFVKKFDLSLDEKERELLLKVFPDGLIAFDLETSGLSPLIDEVVEIAAVRFDSTGAYSFQSLIHPSRDVSQHVINIHGITNEMLKDSPKVQEVLPHFYEFIGNSALVAHNAKFDLGFLVFASHKFNIPLPSNETFCSCVYSRTIYKELKSHRLGNLAKHFKIDLENHHRALDDSLACFKVYLEGLKRNSTDISKALMAKLSDYKSLSDFELPKHLKLLHENIAKQNKIEIKYSGGSMKGVFRPITPMSLLPMPAGNILYAHCLVSDQYKSFALSKIKEVRVPREKKDD